MCFMLRGLYGLFFYSGRTDYYFSVVFQFALHTVDITTTIFKGSA